MITITCTAFMDKHKNKFFVSVHIGIRWVKPAWPAEPIYLTSTLLMGAGPGRTPAQPASTI